MIPAVLAPLTPHRTPSQSRANGQSEETPRDERTGACRHSHGERRGGARGVDARKTWSISCASARPHRQPCRLRARRLRRLHGADRRRRGARLPDARGAMRRRARSRPSKACRTPATSPTCRRRSQRATRLQCGFCTPGMLIDRAAISWRSERRADAAMRSASIFPAIYCRCTGYQAIVDAIEAVGASAPARQDENRADLPSGLSALDRPNSYIGRSVPRPNLARLTQGRGQYVSDVVLPRMAHVAFVRSPHAHARIKTHRHARRPRRRRAWSRSSPAPSLPR